MSDIDGTPGDLRAWLREAEAHGELQTVEGAGWDLEIGALSQVNYRGPAPKALMFDGIPDYARGLAGAERHRQQPAAARIGAGPRLGPHGRRPDREPRRQAGRVDQRAPASSPRRR